MTQKVDALPVGSPLGLHRVVRPLGVLPQAALQLDPHLPLHTDETFIEVAALNIDSASYRQLHEAAGGDGKVIREAVVDIVASRGKMQNPVTGSGGVLVGRVSQVGPDASLGLRVDDRVASLVSLTATPLAITDRLEGWDGHSEHVPARGHAVLFGRSIAAVLPDDLAEKTALAVLDVCGAPALTARVIRGSRRDPAGLRVVVLGGGKSGSLSAAAAREVGAHTVIVVPTEVEAVELADLGIADEIVVADARDPLATLDALNALGALADLTIVCVNQRGCEHAAILATAAGGTVIYFSMATELAAAALGAESVAADVEMLIGSGYVPGHARYALDLFRRTESVRALFESRLG
jgi:L-erythro-3,5-diaminohexanoate dehydrogenase